MIMAGGTGGHIFPALAVAHYLRSSGWDVIWLGTRQGMETKIVLDAGFTMEWIEVSGIRGKGFMRLLATPTMLLRAAMQAWLILKRLRPAVVLGMGGFVTGPGGMVSWLMRIPLVIHEQNSVAGFTNRCLSQLATKVLVAFGHSIDPKLAAILTGNPLRKEMCEIPAPAIRLAERQGNIRVLIIGGSLGSAALNEVVPKSIMQLSIPVDVWHQTGQRNLKATQGYYHGAKVNGRIVAFIDDMAAAYSWADLVVCRAGALTISELAAAGVASILVPYPFAVDDHQTKNACFLVSQDAAIMVSQKALVPSKLRSLLEDLLTDRSRLVTMACNARKCAMINATANVAQACREAAL